LGLGSGVVADSVESDEWAECLAKGEFAKLLRHDFDLIETMRFEPSEGIFRLELHLERMKESARSLGFEFDRHEARNRLHAASFHLDKPSKLRLLLARSGAIAIESGDIPEPQQVPLTVRVVPLPVDPSDFRLHHKTSDRAFYDAARIAAGSDEILFCDAAGFITEGSRSAVFVERGGKLVTPPLSRGLLPSALRRELLESGKAVEGDLMAKDLEDGFWLGSSLRGLSAAKIVA
jgi:para-aminobenzoate synthetase/4-amino-4-deoxychorismate lyase